MRNDVVNASLRTSLHFRKEDLNALETIARKDVLERL